MNSEFDKLVNSIGNLQKIAVSQTLSIYKSRVEEIIISKSQDKNLIEHMLDALCEVAFNDEVLVVFKKLCRYYYKIDEQATFEYIQFYREMWDNEEEE